MQTLWQLVPLGIALAFSTMPILAALLILLSPNRRRSALPFLIGWVGGMFLVAALATMAAQFVPAARVPRRAEETIGALEIIVGALLVAAGVFSLWRGRRRTVEPTIPAWLRGVDRLGPFLSFGLAVLLNFRPKSLLIAVAAGLALRADAHSTADMIIGLSVYTVIGSSTVLVPVSASLISPARTGPRLVAGREWIVRNGYVLTGIILVAVGVLIIVVGAGRL